jgi:hypothetical protein
MKNTVICSLVILFISLVSCVKEIDFETETFQSALVVEASITDEEKIIGFFEVSSVSSKRIFFNYEAYYPNEPQPPYASSCLEISPEIDLGHPADLCGPLLVLIEGGDVLYYRENEFPGPREGPYYVVPAECGDCTRIGTTTVPDFWEE